MNKHEREILRSRLTAYACNVFYAGLPPDDMRDYDSDKDNEHQDEAEAYRAAWVDARNYYRSSYGRRLRVELPIWLICLVGWAVTAFIIGGGTGDFDFGTPVYHLMNTAAWIILYLAIWIGWLHYHWPSESG